MFLVKVLSMATIVATFRRLSSANAMQPLLTTYCRRGMMKHCGLISGTMGIFVFPVHAFLSQDAGTLYDNMQTRLSETSIKQHPVSTASSGTDNTLYPLFMEGTWHVEQTLTHVNFPLGTAFAGGPNAIESIGEASMKEARQKLNEPVALKLRYIKSGEIVLEDRLFNTRERLNNFAGKSVVARVEYSDTRASNRAAVRKATGGSDTDPLATTVVYFKGPAAQKTFVTAHHTGIGFFSDHSGDKWMGFESQRSLFALTNESTAPPIATDSELIFQFSRIDEDHVSGKLRIAGYLNPNDKLYFESRNRAVTLQDYELDLKRIQI